MTEIPDFDQMLTPADSPGQWIFTGGDPSDNNSYTFTGERTKIIKREHLEYKIGASVVSGILGEVWDDHTATREPIEAEVIPDDVLLEALDKSLDVFALHTRGYGLAKGLLELTRGLRDVEVNLPDPMDNSDLNEEEDAIKQRILAQRMNKAERVIAAIRQQLGLDPNPNNLKLQP